MRYKLYILVKQFDALTLNRVSDGTLGWTETRQGGEMLDHIENIIIAIMDYNNNDKSSDVRYSI